MKQDPRRSPLFLPLGMLIGLVGVICISLVVYRPDRQDPILVPGSSSGPTFRVQIIRPRMGLPLGGILPPELFGLEGHLGFDSGSAGASIDHVAERRLELRADGWEMILLLDEAGRVSPESRVVFELQFEEEPRKVHGRPGGPVVGTVSTTALETGELSGHFHVELAHCEDADTGEPLGWPPQPLVLHGSFDRLSPDTAPEAR